MSNDLLALLNKLHDQSLEFFRGVTFDKQLEADGYIVCLYASLIELAGGIVTLVERDRRTALSAVFRTFLEAYVDFRNLSADPTYIKNCYARHHKNWIKVLKHAEDANPYLSGIRGHADRDDVLHRHETQLERLNREKFRPLSVHARFERVGMAEEYSSIYHFESDGVHNNLQALIHRHVEQGQADFGLALYKERSLDDYTACLDTTAALLVDATERIHHRLKSGRQTHVKALGEELAALRSTSA